MPIQVTCPGCLKRFSVNDKFAGQSGPCPNCRKIIKIPAKAEEVVIHAPEDSSPKDSKGKSVLKPIRRKEVLLSVPVILTVSLISLTVLGIALAVRFSMPNPPAFLLAAGAILLAPPLTYVGYWFLRDDELEGYGGRELLARCGICSLIFAAAWLLYTLIPMYLIDGYRSLADISVGYMIVLIPLMIVLGTIASVLIFELEIMQGMLHYMLYFALTLILAIVCGTRIGQPMADPNANLASEPTIKRQAPVPKSTAKPQQPANAVTKDAEVKPPEKQPEGPKVNVLQ